MLPDTFDLEFIHPLDYNLFLKSSTGSTQKPLCIDQPIALITSVQDPIHPMSIIILSTKHKEESLL